MTSHSIRNILAFVDSIQGELELSAIQKASRSSASWQALHGRVSKGILTAVGKIDAALRGQGLSAGELAIRSRRAYQWLCFLSKPESLALHLDALQRVNLYLPAIQRASSNGKSVQVSFYHQGALYQVREREGFLEMQIQESYITAPDQILTGLLELSLQPGLKANRRAVKDYTFSSAYQQIREELEYLEVPRGSFAAGSAHDLRDSFQRVNQAYFKGRLAQPNLIWNKRLTRRKFGHYQWDTDTVMVSSSLDHPGVPRLAVDYVMYHELLHKKLGARKAAQNRIAHTAEFRRAESAYKDLARAKRVLNRIARSRW